VLKQGEKPVPFCVPWNWRITDSYDWDYWANTDTGSPGLFA